MPLSQRHILTHDETRRINQELNALDPVLREVVGPSVLIDRRWTVRPGMHVTMRRGDGVTVGLTIGPILRGPIDPTAIRYMVAPSAWLDLAGERLQWRAVPQWTVELATPEALAAARLAIAEAWRQATSVDRNQILAAPPPPPTPFDDEA